MSGAFLRCPFSSPGGERGGRSRGRQGGITVASKGLELAKRPPPNDDLSPDAVLGNGLKAPAVVAIRTVVSEDVIVPLRDDLFPRRFPDLPLEVMPRLVIFLELSSVDKDLPTRHFDRLPWEPDHALDQVLRGVLARGKYDDVLPLNLVKCFENDHPLAIGEGGLHALSLDLVSFSNMSF